MKNRNNRGKFRVMGGLQDLWNNGLFWMADFLLIHSSFLRNTADSFWSGAKRRGYIGIYTPKISLPLKKLCGCSSPVTRTDSIWYMFTCGTLTYVLNLQWLVKTYTPKSNSWQRPCFWCSPVVEFCVCSRLAEIVYYWVCCRNAVQSTLSSGKPEGSIHTVKRASHWQKRRSPGERAGDRSLPQVIDWGRKPSYQKLAFGARF